MKKTIGLILLCLGALAAVIAYIQTKTFAYELNSVVGEVAGIGGIPTEVIVIIAGICAVIAGIILLVCSKRSKK